MSHQKEGGCGFSLLGIAFIVLKLTGVIDWSWLWVLAPFWGPFLFGLLMMSLVLTVLAKADSKNIKITRR